MDSSVIITMLKSFSSSEFNKVIVLEVISNSSSVSIFFGFFLIYTIRALQIFLIIRPYILFLLLFYISIIYK